MQLPTPSSSSSAPKPGNASAWLLSFLPEDSSNFTITETPALEINGDQYYCDIHASLPGGLEGGSYTFVVEGLSDDHYASIAQGATTSPTVVRLYLYWNDNADGAAGYLKNLAGIGPSATKKGSDIPDKLVAELRIVSVTRKAGSRKYDTTITARERAFDVLNTRHLPKPGITQKKIADAIHQLLDSRLLDSSGQPNFELHSFDEPSDAPERTLEAGHTLLEHLRTLASRIEDQTNQHGRGMVLIRNGKLHIGPRKIPLTGDASPLTVDSGLLETEVTGRQLIDQYFDCASHPDASPAQRRQFRLTLKGRPDIHPGDTVSFELPPEDQTTVGGAYGAASAVVDLAKSLGSAAGLSSGGLTVKMYVDAVEHKLSRTSSFATTLTGVEVTDGSPWDTWTVVEAAVKKPAQPAAAHPTAEQESARAVARLVQREVGRVGLPEVGEVRAMQAQDAGADPAQTITVWQGLSAPSGGSDAAAEQARRLDVARPSPLPMAGVPYVTPFAWGKCGLVLPRYPGTRVFVAHRGGQRDDPVDIGALWRTGATPTNAKPGDWWLSLPANAPTGDDKHVAIGDSETANAYADVVSNDLIDARGNRAVEALTFVIRVGQGELKNAGDRPVVSSGDPILQIEVKKDNKTSSISIDASGNMSLSAAGDLTLSAPQGNINLKAQNVKVTVGSSMDVSQGSPS